MSRVAVVTDSTSDLTPALAERYGITVVPLFVNFGNERFKDGIELSREQFFERLRAGDTLPTTSQPTSRAFEEAYRPHVEAGDSIVSIHITQSLSGTINAARAAAEQFPGGRIELFDSHTVTGGCALLALHAAELAAAGAPLESVLRELDSDRAAQQGYCTLPDLSHVRRTGRISNVQAALGGILKIVPVLNFGQDGVGIQSRVRTFARAQETLVDLTVAQLGDVAHARIMVLHADAPERGGALLAQLRAKLSVEPAFLQCCEAGPAIATHAGPGALGIFSIAGRSASV